MHSPQSIEVLLAMSDSSREVLAELLQDDGYLVSSVAGAPEALAELAVHQPDVVIFNLANTDLVGVARLRSALRPEARLLVVSALSHVGRDALRAGASEFFAKPLNYVRLLRAIQKSSDAPMAFV